MVNEKMLTLGQNRSSIREIFEYAKKRKAEIGADKVYDFSLGNPSVPAPRVVNDTLLRLLRDKPVCELHAYTSAPGDFSVRKAISDYINKTYSAKTSPELIYMTCGAAASLTATLTALTDKEDEVIVFAPFFPEYRVFIERCGARLVSVSGTDDFQIDEASLRKSVTPRTKVVIVNSPNNPTGAILNDKSVRTLSSVLSEKSKEYGHPIYLLSDEPYREITYGKEVLYLPHYYENTVISYSFSKSLSLPGERIGYILVSEKAENRDDVFNAICGAGRALGFVCAPSIFQYLVKEVVGCTSDISVYKENRDLLYSALTNYGFEAIEPDGAFYLFLKSPIPDAKEFCETAKKFELLLVPSDDFGCKGFARIAYCVSTEQIKNSLSAFRKLAKEYNLKEKN